MTDIFMTADQLRAARRELGWTQEQLGSALNITHDHVRKWAADLHKVHPCAAKLIQIYLEFPELRPKFTNSGRPLRNC